MDASTLSSAQRADLGITTKLPKSIAESSAALKRDEDLKDLLGKGFVRNYLIVKRRECDKLNAMNEAERRKWLVEQY